jgi:hypothetical protein
MTLPAPEPADVERLAALLRTLGASDDEIAVARETHGLGPLALEVVLRAGSEPIGLDEAAARLGATPDEVARYWRALGFADPANRRFPARFIETQTVISQAATEWLGDESVPGWPRRSSTPTGSPSRCPSSRRAPITATSSRATSASPATPCRPSRRS